MPNVRFESYMLTTEPIKRMRVRTFGKKVSKVKTDHRVLRKAEQQYGGGGETIKTSNRRAFNSYEKAPVDNWKDLLDTDVALALEYKEGLHVGEWVGTEKVKPMRGMNVKYSITAELSPTILETANIFLKEILRFKRIDHVRMLKDFAGFEQKRKDNLERIRILFMTRTELSPKRRQLLRDLNKKWKVCNAHTRYTVSTDVLYDFTGKNDSNSIKWRGIRVGTVLVEKVFADGGIFFNRKQCQGIEAWLEANRTM